MSRTERIQIAQDAAIHDDLHAGGPRPVGLCFIDDAILDPQARQTEAQAVIDGAALSVALRAQNLFPDLFLDMVAAGNGGYVAGLVGTALAIRLDETLVPQVTLRMPPPLDKDLDLAADVNGARLLDAEALVAEAVPVESEFLAEATIDAVSPEEARVAEASMSERLSLLA